MVRKPMMRNRIKPGGRKDKKHTGEDEMKFHLVLCVFLVRMRRDLHLLIRIRYLHCRFPASGIRQETYWYTF